ncbi:MAG: hypothetical protein Q4F97_06330 [Bacteroidales bacterium]|nr:hypothetical protein [Bacteroidales bacterium]
MKESFNNFLYKISSIAILISAALYILFPAIMPYIFAVAAAGYAISKLNSRYLGTNLRIKRLFRMQKLSGFAMIAASYLMFKPHNQWIPLLLIAAFIELYSSYAIAHEEKKENNEQ